MIKSNKSARKGPAYIEADPWCTIHEQLDQLAERREDLARDCRPYDFILRCRFTRLMPRTLAACDALPPT